MNNKLKVQVQMCAVAHVQFTCKYIFDYDGYVRGAYLNPTDGSQPLGGLSTNLFLYL